MKIVIHTPNVAGELEVKEELNSNFWDGDKLKKVVRDQLLKIATEFIDTLKIKNLVIDDIILTGSLANYNWCESSDVDLHIVIDFNKLGIDEELISDFFNLKRLAWNNNHDVKIYNHEVEVYIQDEKEPHYSTGVYSLEKDEWLTRPTQEKPDIDQATVEKKTSTLMKDVDNLERFGPEKAFAMAMLLKDKVKKMRQIGLEKGGVYSPENLAFKALRRNDYLKKLNDIKNDAYDKTFSLPEENNLTTEVHTDKQRRFMCSMMKPGANRPDNLSQAEAEEMCKSSPKSVKENTNQIYKIFINHDFKPT